MATLKILSKKREATLQYLLRHKMRKTERRDQTPREVACSHGAVPPRNLENHQES